MAGRRMGVSMRPRRQLESVGLAVTHGGLPALWRSAWRPPCNEPAVACGQRAAALSALEQDDRSGLAERICGGALRLAPLHVESVAWISERKDVLSAFFFMLTLWAYAALVEV